VSGNPYKLLADFRTLIDLVSANPDYQPAHSALASAALNAQYAAASAAVQDEEDKQSAYMSIPRRPGSKDDIPSFVSEPRKQASARVRQLLYDGDNSVVDTALLVREYVKNAFGTESQLYQQIKRLEFKK
jgi:hypothetical protein